MENTVKCYYDCKLAQNEPKIAYFGKSTQLLSTNPDTVCYAHVQQYLDENPMHLGRLADYTTCTLCKDCCTPLILREADGTTIVHCAMTGMDCDLIQIF